MDLVIYTPAENEFIKAIEFNHEEIKTQVTSKVAIYNQMVFTEETVRSAKQTISDLRKFKTAIDDKRKAIKSQCMAPYLAFEEKIREITSLIDEPINKIDAQIKEFDAQRKAEKIQRLREYFEQQADDLELSNFIRFEQIKNPRWENVSFTDKAACEEIDDALTASVRALKTLENLNSDFQFEVIETYKDSLSLEKALAKDAELRAQAEKKKEYEAAKAAKEVATTPEPSKSLPKDAGEPATEVTSYELSFKVTGTKEQLVALRDFMKSIGLKAEKI